MKATDTEQRDFLLACSAWQDSLLQNYRTFHVTIQGFLMAAGAAVLAVQLSGAIQDQNSHPFANAIFHSLYTALLVFLCLLQSRTSKELMEVVKNRALDIDYWHKRVILSENAFDPDQRVFTHFKRWQHAKRASVEHVMGTSVLDAQGLNDSDAELLIGKGLGHTRRVLDVNLFQRIQHIWYAIVLSSGGITVWFVYQWCKLA